VGNHKGKSGKVLKVFVDRQRVIVEGVALVKKHTKPNQKNPQGGIISQEAPIHVSNVMVICPHTDKPTRVGRRRLEDGSLVRYSKKSPAKEIIS
jgi:large subunit ribosomal protein L24